MTDQETLDFLLLHFDWAVSEDRQKRAHDFQIQGKHPTRITDIIPCVIYRIRNERKLTHG